MSRNLIMGSPAFGVYLLALAVLPFRWLSLRSLQQHAQWTDILVALAAGLWTLEKLRAGELHRSLRLWHVPLGLYVVFGAVSAAFELPGLRGNRTTVLLMIELAALAVITADFASEPARRRAIARVIVASSATTVALGALGVALFYAHVSSGLIGGYGDLLPSSHYARVQAGFESPDLLASFCIFASGIAASDDAQLSRRLRIVMQVALGLLCAATFSRGLIGFILAAILRRSARLKGRGRELVPVAAALVSIIIIAALSVGSVTLNPANPSSFSYVASGASPRHQAFVTSLKTLEHHPLVGVGPGALPGANNVGAPFRAHFTPLNVAATLGLPALAALVATVVLVWRGRRRPTEIALWSAAAGITLDGLAQDIDHFRHVWVLLGLLGS